MNGENRDFFISYTQADRAWAEWIAWTLEDAGYDVLVQAWDFRPGMNFAALMHEGVRKCERTIAVLSDDYLKSVYGEAEWLAAWIDDPLGREGKLLPVRVRESRPEGLLKGRVYIDLFGVPEARAKAELLAGVRSERAKPAARPGFPGAAPRPAATRFPGALPEIWSVPHRRNPDFAGRDGALAAIRENARSGSQRAFTQVVAGLGGVGKTQLASEFCYRYGAEYEVVWWVRAEEIAALTADLAALAVRLGAAGQDSSNVQAAAKLCLEWLEHNRGWLIVFDNATDTVQFRQWLPKMANGHVLITSRDVNWYGVGTPVMLPVFDREDSVRFLLRARPDGEREAAGALAEEVGDLPLALDQALAFISGTGDTLAGYVELFRQRAAELLDQHEETMQYPLTVAASVDVSLEKLASENPGALELLNLFAFLAPDAIPVKLPETAREHLPETLQAVASDPLRRKRAFGALRKYSLIDAAGELCSVHRVVQAVVRGRLRRQSRFEECIRRVLVCVEAAFPYDRDTPLTWPESEVLLPHCLACTQHARESAPMQETSRLLNRVGDYLWNRVQPEAAEEVLRRALEINSEIHGPDDVQIAKDLNDLGQVLIERGKFSDAQRFTERAIEIAERVCGSMHEDVSDFYNNLGTVLYWRRFYERARLATERSMEIERELNGQRHPRVAVRCNNLGRILESLGDLVQARESVERALDIDKEHYGERHPNVAIRLGNLARIHRKQGDLPGSRVLAEQAIEIAVERFGHEHPRVARHYDNLAQTLLPLGEVSRAKELAERAVSILKKHYGRDHPITIEAEETLAEAIRKAGAAQSASG